MQTTKQKRQTKQNFEQFSEQILPWLESALDYLDSNYWEFSVSKKGKYEPAVQLIEDPPEDFVFETEEPRGKILFRLPRQQIRTVEELANAQERVWKDGLPSLSLQRSESLLRIRPSPTCEKPMDSKRSAGVQPGRWLLLVGIEVNEILPPIKYQSEALEWLVRRTVVETDGDSGAALFLDPGSGKDFDHVVPG